MKIYKEYGFAWNLRRVITPDFTTKELEDLITTFNEEFSEKKEIIVFGIDEWNFLFINKVLKGLIKEDIIADLTTILSKTLGKEPKSEYRPQYVKYKLKTNYTLIITTAPCDLPEKYINWK